MDNRIKEIRQQKGMTLEAVATACNTQKSQISNLENGNRRLSVDWMRLLARALDCAPADLLIDEDAGLRLSDQEAELIRSIRACNDTGRAVAFRTALAAIDDDTFQVAAGQ